MVAGLGGVGSELEPPWKFSGGKRAARRQLLTDELSAPANNPALASDSAFEQAKPYRIQATESDV